MIIAHKFEQLLSDNKLTKKDFCAEIGISTTALDNALKGGDMRISNLLKIAEYFNLPVDYFIRENKDNTSGIGNNLNIQGNGNRLSHITQTECQKEVEHLKAILAEKEAVIVEKERTIQILLNKL